MILVIGQELLLVGYLLVVVDCFEVVLKVGICGLCFCGLVILVLSMVYWKFGNVKKVMEYML